MTDWQMTAPVAMLIFNRPDTTRRVFAAVRAARPPVLLVVADGPRPDRPGEAERCAAARDAVLANVDWPCRVLTDLADANLGCRRRVSSGLSWVFEQVESAIVLEDDCLPDPTFFRYCDELLDRYRDDPRVFMISGDNFETAPRPAGGDYDYHFSRYTFIWGWASWRRAWRQYDVDMPLWPAVRDGGWLADLWPAEPDVVRYWASMFEETYRGRINTWDFQLSFAMWANHGLSILPRTNLVTNIGFGPEATHTTGASPLADRPTAPLAFPLRHPPFLIRDARADAQSHAVVCGRPGLHRRLAGKLRRLLARRA